MGCCKSRFSARAGKRYSITDLGQGLVGYNELGQFLMIIKGSPITKEELVERFTCTSQQGREDWAEAAKEHLGIAKNIDAWIQAGLDTGLIREVSTGA